ncbi:hypothetical protein EV175_001025 [Coemansia sp. RSA 1933]|nr:hypothetical protein EV175_001025 [Coemansia sp. RSA 1933]
MRTVACLRILSPLRVDRIQYRCFGTTTAAASVLAKLQLMFNQVQQERLAEIESSMSTDLPVQTTGDDPALPKPEENAQAPNRETASPSPSPPVSAAQLLREQLNQERKQATPAAWLPKVYKDFEQPQDPELCKAVIFGTANAGKSTLLNRLTGVDVSIVSSRPQTTRTRIAASTTEGNKQLVFLDTPGVVSKKALRRVARTVVTTSWQTLTEADVIVLVIDAYKLTEKTDEVEKFIFGQLAKNCSVPAILIVNKADLAEDREKLAAKVDSYAKEYPHIVAGPLYVSALNGSNVDELKALLFERTRPANWMFPRNIATDMSDMMRVEECIRAEWFALMTGHLPYTVRQRNVGWEVVNAPVEQREYYSEQAAEGGSRLVERAITSKRKVLAIDQELVVTTGSVAKILLGTNGNAVKKMSGSAASKISLALGIPVRLHLQVVVEKDTRKHK